MILIFEFPIVAIILFIALLIMGPYAVLSICSSILPIVTIIAHLYWSILLHKEEEPGPLNILSTPFECFTIGFFLSRYPYPVEKLKDGIIDGSISFLLAILLPIGAFIIGMAIFKYISVYLYQSDKAWWVRWLPVFISFIAFVLTVFVIFK